MKLANIIKRCNEQDYQLLISFIYGAIVGPYATSLVILVLSLILVEVVYAICNISYSITSRYELLYAYLAGWIISRTIFCDEIFPNWIP